MLEKHQGILYKVTRVYAKSSSDEEDLRQEIYYQAWRSYPKFQGRAKFSTWLYRLALNVAMTHMTKDRKERDKRDALGETLSQNYDGNAGERELLISHIKQLNAADKLIIMLHLDGYPNEEVAELAGISKSHLAVKIHRIKEKLTLQIRNSLT